MKAYIRFISLLDWVVASATLGWGVWTGSTLWLAAGAFGFLVAWYRPAARVQGYLKTKFIKKDVKAQATQEALTSEALIEETLRGLGVDEPETPAPLHFRRSLAWGAVALSANRHNQLRAPYLGTPASAEQGAAPWV